MTACFQAFSESVPLLSPEAAVKYFQRLEPLLGVDPHRFGPDQERQAFTLAAATEETLLDRVQELIADGLASGQISDRPDAIQALLDEAGITPSNPQYAEMVFRTNAADAYNQGAWEEYRSPDVEDEFPAWEYSNPDDERSRDSHAARNGRYYPAARSFNEVRGTHIHDVANCRCTFLPITKSRWKQLQAQGAKFHTFSERFAEKQGSGWAVFSDLHGFSEAFVEDAHGHEHGKDGKFTSKGNGGSGSPQGGGPRPAPSAASGAPDTSKGSLVHLRTLVNGFGGDMNRAVDMVRAAAKKHEDNGGQVFLHIDGKRIPVRVEGNKFVDAKGQPWGAAALAFDTPNQPGLVEFAPLGQPGLPPDVFKRLLGTAMGGAQPKRYSERTPTAEAENGQALAELYADTFNLIGQGGQFPSEDELHRAHVELQTTDWQVDYDPEAKRWVVRHAGPEAGVHSFAERAPKGGIHLNGRFFRGGQWIPNKELEDASPEDRAKLAAAKEAHVSKRRDRGSINASALEAKLNPYADKHGPDSAEGKRFGFTSGWERRVFKALHNYHGELTLHRLEELATTVHEALERTPADEEGIRRQLEQRLAAYGRMVKMAQNAGISGRVSSLPTLPDEGKIQSGGSNNGNLDTTGGADTGRLPSGEQLGTDAAKEPGSGAGEGAGDGTASVPASTDEQRDGAGGAHGGAGHPAGTGPEHGPGESAGHSTLSEKPTPENPTDVAAPNWHYSDKDFLQTGLKAKFKDNLAALQTLRTIRAEGRDTATPAEQAILSKYIGWGQFPGLFNVYDGDWEKERNAVKGLLTDEEWEAARASTTNAHYTHPDVVEAHWKMAERLGFKKGRFLETSAGIGYYLGMLPENLAGKVKPSAVELDKTTAAMLKLLYPGANVKNQGFQDFQAPDNFYDLVASNVPFSKSGPFDPRYAKFNASLHDYFFLKSMDLCRDGGLVMHITSAGTMDKADPKIRAELASKGDLVAAIRFPGGAHQENAGTSVVTDMLIFRKRPKGEAPVDPNVTPAEAEPKEPGFTGVTTDALGRVYHWVNGKRVPGDAWTQVTTVPDPDGGEPITVNKYFADNPHNVLGRIDRTGTMYSAGQANVSMATPEELSEGLGRKVEIKTDQYSGKRKFVYADTGETVPNADMQRVGHELYQKRLQDAIERLPQNIMQEAKNSTAAFEPSAQPAPGDTKDGGYKVQNGKLYQRQGGGLVEQEAKPKDLERIGGMLAIRDALRAVINDQLNGKNADESRKKLGEVYDAYVKKHKALNDNVNKRLMRCDPDGPVLLALEHYDSETKTAKKADIFTRDTIRPDVKRDKAADVGEALGISLHEKGGIDVARMAALLGKGQEEIGAELVKAGLAYQDPESGWKPADQYLSGNVRKKLVIARAAAEADPKFRANVEALEKVQPEDIDHEQIEVRIGASWVPPSDIKDFFGELLSIDKGALDIGYVPTSGEWTVQPTSWGKNALWHSQIARNTWGTERADFADLLRSALNNKSLTIRDTDPDGNSYVNKKATDDANAKVQELKEAFRGWIWEDDARRERLHRYYNDNFNNIRAIHYDGSHQTFPGQNPEIQLRDHQKNFVWQVVTTGKGLAAHEVGTGKTYSMIASAMELRRLGLAKKPAIACLKANVEAITQDALRLYPGAKILSTADMFDAKKRKETISKIATGDYDMIILTHDHLNLLQMKPETVQQYIKEEMDDLEAAKMAVMKDNPKATAKNNKVIKQLENAKAKLEAKLKEALDSSKKDNAVYFEETGIDHLFVDEAHKYKTLPVYTKQDRVKGIPTGRSDRATAMQMRTRWLQEQNNGRGVVFATGTPVANTMAELYTMQRYLQPNELRERGLWAFDAWASCFGDMQTRMEFTVSGEYKPVSRFAKFVNIPELMQMVRGVMDVQRAEDLRKDDGSPAIVRPNRHDKIIASPKSDAMEGLMKSLQARAEEIKKRSGPAQKGDDNMLVICTDGRKGAIDMRLLNANAVDDPNSKTNQCVRKVLELNKANPGMTQCIFSDVGVNAMRAGKAGIGEEAIAEDEGEEAKGMSKEAAALAGSNTSFHLYGDIINKLVKGGIPREKIADFSQLAGAKKEEAMEAMRKGEILVALGSTEKLGTGVNVQNKLGALHHLDVPWLPASLEQRDGRGWRQGNENKDLDIYRYVSEGSLDQTFWQIIGNKTRFIKQVVTPGENVQRIARDEDSEELSPEQLMAAASGDPRILQKVNLEQEVKTLEAAAGRHQREQIRLKNNVAAAEKQQPVLERHAANLDEGAKTLADNPEFKLTIGGKHYTDRKEASEALAAKNAEADARADEESAKLPYWQREEHPPEEIIGNYRGLEIVRKGKTGAGTFFLRLPNGHEIGTGDSLGSVEAVARRIPKLATEAREDAAKHAEDLKKVKAGIGKAFAKADELAAKKKAVADLDQELRGKKEGEGEGEETSILPPPPKPTFPNLPQQERNDQAQPVPSPKPDAKARIEAMQPVQPTGGTPPGMKPIESATLGGQKAPMQAIESLAGQLHTDDRGGRMEGIPIHKIAAATGLHGEQLFQALNDLRKQGKIRLNAVGNSARMDPENLLTGPSGKEQFGSVELVEQPKGESGQKGAESAKQEWQDLLTGIDAEKVTPENYQAKATTMLDQVATEELKPFLESIGIFERPKSRKDAQRIVTSLLGQQVEARHRAQSAGGSQAQTSPATAAQHIQTLAARNHGQVSLADLREALGNPPVPELHKLVNDLRRSGAIEGVSWEGRQVGGQGGEPTPREKEAMIVQPSSRTHGQGDRLVHVAVSDPGKLAQIIAAR